MKHLPRRDCLLLMAGTVSLAAHSARPNLSGRWKMDFQRSELGRKMRSGGYFEELIIEHREPLVTIDYRLHFDGRFSEVLYQLNTEGGEVRTETPVGLEISTTSWIGNKLVTDWKTLGARRAENRIMRFLSEDSKQLNVQYGRLEQPKTLFFVRF